ncbi:MAG TPA: hypothetical protein VLD67_13315 [Vicinamibacterales bacterium]|nr:hypothetical protein [Vicinamibacterales bacterium]
MDKVARSAAYLLVPILGFGLLGASFQKPPHDDQWPAYGGDPGGTRYSPLQSITRANVSQLQVAWTYRTGKVGENARDGADLTFEAAPSHFDGRLQVSTAFGRVIALDPASGKELWTYDANVDRGRSYSEVTSRGVSAWRDPDAGAEAPCATRYSPGRSTPA